MYRLVLTALLALTACQKNVTTSSVVQFNADNLEDIQQINVEADKSGRLVIRFAPKYLKVKRRVAPRYPVSETIPPGVTVRCLATVTINTDGRAYEVDVANCNQQFQTASINALEQWRWQPVIWRGNPVRARTHIYVSFRRSHS
jgi:hypothetical protein